MPVFSPPLQAANDRLTITNLRAWRIKEPVSNRRYTVVRVETRGGESGYGEGATAQPHEIADAKAAIVGRRANEAEFVRHRLNESPALEAAVNDALLDVLGKTSNVPVYQFLGGPTRFKARVLAHLEGKDENELLAVQTRAVRQGFRAFTIPLPERDPLTRIQAYVDRVRARVDRFRAAGGENTDLVLDGNGSLTPGDAAYLATALEKQHVMWFDEPTEVQTNDSLAKITDESVMPVGLGRHVHDVTTFQNLLRWGCIDILRPSVGLNSSRKLRRMAAVAETHYIAIAPYHVGGPISTIAAIHLAASLPNSFIQQIPVPAAEQDAAMRAELLSGTRETATDGFAALSNRPGLGVQVSEAALNKYSEETV
jgi:galactonate dehydratase